MTQPQPDGSTIVTANYVAQVPSGCTGLQARDGFTRYQCAKEQPLEVTAP
ncbi:MAG: hypothetical protein NDJ89_18825 [Oligoflexia bacterium]|nr:hypothetical protein [Oligoflexia bacterium]